MRSRIVSRRTLAIALAGLTSFAAFHSHFIPQKSVQGNWTASSQNTASNAPPKQEQASPGFPLRLKIPEIDIDTPIEQVGLTPDGAMDITKSPDKVAWYKQGPRPGENGSAVIAGHYGWQNGETAAFDNLHKLQKGHKVLIQDDKGATTTFVVRETRSYDLDAGTSDVFGSHDGQPHLNLITCEGAWDKAQKTYSKRLVVFTDKE